MPQRARRHGTISGAPERPAPRRRRAAGTANARDAAGNMTTSLPVTVTVSNTTPAALTIDANTSADQPLASIGTITTLPFSTTSINELLLAFISTDDSSTGNTVTSVTGAG